MKIRSIYAGCFCLLLACALPVAATTITYDLSNISGNTWEYTYVLNNDSLAIDIDEFTVYFDANLYSNLSVISAPLNWDPLVIQPNNFLNNEGFYDALALVSGLVPGESLGGFAVRFDYLGMDTPGAQYFEVVDALSFSVLDSGMTSPVPVPAAIGLFASGLLGLLGLARRKFMPHIA